MYAIIKQRDIVKFEIATTGFRKTATQIRNAYAKQYPEHDIYIMNAGFYNTSNLRPVMDLRVDNKSLASAMQYPGLGSSPNGVAYLTPHEGHKREFFVGGYPMILNGVNQQMRYTPSAAYRRGRSGGGVLANGDLLLVCVKDGSSQAMSSNALLAFMKQRGAVNATMYDGGGSSQGNFAGERVTSTRKVHNHIVIIVRRRNIYTVPTRTIRRGSAGSQVRWVQFQLRSAGINVDIDGRFGPATEAAVKYYQRSRQLEDDGRVGPATKQSLLMEG